MSAHASFENLLEFHNLWNFNIFRGLPHYNRQIIIFAKGKMGYLPISPTFNAVIWAHFKNINKKYDLNNSLVF